MEINSLFTLKNISLISTGLINLILFILIGMRNNKSKNTYFFLGFILSVFGWTVGVLAFRILEIHQAFIAAQLVYFSAVLIPLFLILFIQNFPTPNQVLTKGKLTLTLIPAILCLIACLIPGAIIKDIHAIAGERIIRFGFLYYFYSLYIITYFLIGIGMMMRKYFVLEGIEKRQIEVIFFSIIVSATVGVFTNLVFPSFGYFSLFWVGPFYSIFMVLVISYAIVKYSLFNVKLIATEFVIFSTWALMFARIFFSQNTTDEIINAVVFLIILISGIYIIRGVIKEIVLREKDDMLVSRVTSLNKNLEKTNLKLKDLDAKKSEFMSLATHQLRAPLTAMKGYSSMILDGTLGKIDNPEVEDAINKITRSTTDLAMIVEDYLNISRIEQGRMQYTFTSFDMCELVKTVVKELKINADRAGIILELHCDAGTEMRVSADQGKIKQVITNLLDNSIKYTPSGRIDVYITKTTDKMRVKIQDTGVGIKPEVLPLLFQKFTRAPDAGETNILGTGLGLYVAGEIMKAHAGKVWAESAGQGKGSQFYVELNLLN